MFKVMGYVIIKRFLQSTTPVHVLGDYGSESKENDEGRDENIRF